jgi:hypothetical protein
MFVFLYVCDGLRGDYSPRLARNELPPDGLQ